MVDNECEINTYLTIFPYFSNILCISLLVNENGKLEIYTVDLLGTMPPLIFLRKMYVFNKVLYIENFV